MNTQTEKHTMEAQRGERVKHMNCYAKINAKGQADLMAWLADNLKSGAQNAEQWAETLLSRLDCSSPDSRDISIELSSFHSLSGNPETYLFGPDQYDIIEIDPAGNDVRPLT